MPDLKLTTENFIKHGFEAQYFDTAEAACEYICGRVKNTTVGFGGSITLKEIGLYEKLSKENSVFWHWVDKGDRVSAGSAEVYMSSANGISESGEFVNIDGSGNRVASTIFGHEEVYIIAGKNKIEKDLHSAINRAKNIASPINGKRIGGKTPCAIDGDKCFDCNSSDRICNVTSIIERKPFGTKKYVIVLIDEDLGY